MAKEIKADYVIFSAGMTMRNNQAIWFLKRLSKEFPELIPKYEDIYQFTYMSDQYNGTYAPKKSYFRKITKKVLEEINKYKIPYRIKRFIPNDYRRINYIISEKLLNQAYDLQIEGKAYSNTHWAGQNIQNLKESIVEVAERDELRGIRNVNREIESFVYEEIDRINLEE